MFAKLIKNEWRCCRQVLGVLCLITLGAGVMIGLSAAWLAGGEGRRSYLLATLLSMLGTLAIGICAAGGFFYLIWRFYQSRFTDEGYLTFTLPVTNHQQLLAALVNIFRGSFLVLLAALGAFVLIGLCYLLIIIEDWGYFFQSAWEYLPRFWEGINWTGCLEVLAMLLVVFAALVMKLMLCVTVGAVLARKHKLLTAVAAWFGIGFLQTWGLFALGFSDAFSNSLFLRYGFGSNLVIVIAGYLLTHWLTEKKLNLT